MAVLTIRIGTTIDVEIDPTVLGIRGGMEREEVIDRIMLWWDNLDDKMQRDILLNPDTMGVERWELSEVSAGYIPLGEVKE